MDAGQNCMASNSAEGATPTASRSNERARGRESGFYYVIMAGGTKVRAALLREADAANANGTPMPRQQHTG